MRLKKTIKAQVEVAGDVEATDGKLIIKEVGRRELDAAKAWPVLAAERWPTDKEGVTVPGAAWKEDDFARVVEMSLGSVGDVIAEKAGKGNGASAIRAVTEQLTRAGAITNKTHTELSERPARTRSTK